MMSNVLMILGVFFISMGLVGIIRFQSFYSRLMASTLIDTAGYILILLGVIIRSGLNTATVKILFLLFGVIMINPIFTHFIIQSAWKTGHKEDVKGDWNG